MPKLNFAGGKSIATVGDPAFWLDSQPRVAGKIAIFKITPANITGIDAVGWDTAATGDILDALKFNAATGIQVIANGGAAVVVGAYAAATTYLVAAVMRATGINWYIRGGAYTYWSFIRQTMLGSGAGLPSVQAQNPTSTFSVDFIRIPADVWLSPPLASDSFTDASVTDGKGHAEGLAGGIGAGGANVPWAAAATWSVAGGVCINTPVPVAGELLTDGVFDNWNSATDLTSWTETLAGTSTVNRENAVVKTAPFSTRFDIDGATSSVLINQALVLAANKFITITLWARGSAVNTAGKVSRNNVEFGATFTPGVAGFVQYRFSTKTQVANATIGIVRSSGASTSLYIDDVSINELTLAELFRLLSISMTPDIVATIKVAAIASGNIVGLAIRGDVSANPASGIIAYADGSSITCDEFSAGVWTQLFTAVKTFAANDTLQLIASGSSVRLIHITAAGVATLIGSTAAATVTTGGYHGLLSTAPGNTITDFAVWPAGTGNEHAILDRWSQP